MKQWECRNCDSTNYLDENGDITDPPVATFVAAPADRTYAIPRSESPLNFQESDSAVFCSTCLKNQHLLRASLSQFEVELDPSKPEYKQNERNYFKYKQGLEMRYPQVCEDCEPKVLLKMREANKTARTDYLRRLMEKSRARWAAAPSSVISLESVGQLLWYLGLFGQLLWHIMSLSATIQHYYPSFWEQFILRSVQTFFLNLSDSVPLSMSGVAKSSLFCSIISSWWNPKFKQVKVGFMNHVTGFGDWYKYQALIIAIRSLCYLVMGTGVLADPYATSTTTAHIFIFGFVTYLAIAAHYSLKVDMTPLWTTPQKIKYVGPSSTPSPLDSTRTMSDLLDEIGKAPPQGSHKRSSISSPQSSYQRNGYHLDNYQQSDYERGGYQQNNYHGDDSLQESQSIYKKPTPQISLQPRKRPPPSLFVQNDALQTNESMDWSPSQPQSQHRAFAPNIQQSNAQLFGQTPVDPNTSPFWYKVPPAPITPAQRLRNPPNQPRLRVSSQEVKENFFNNVTRKTTLETSNQSTTLPSSVGPRSDVKFAQQKFFPPTSPGEADNTLSDLFTSFSLSSSADELPTQSNQSYRIRHIFQGLGLFVGLVFWNQVLNNPSELTVNVLLAIMLGCFFIGLRMILDNVMEAVSKNKSKIARAFEVWLGFIECAAAAYGAVEIIAGRGHCADCASLGNILIGGMMVHELFPILFG